MLSEFKETETNPLIFKQKLAEFKYSKQNGIEIYTDGSRNKKKVAVAAVINKDIFSARLPDETTLFSGEAKAIKLAFQYIKMSKYTHFRIISDSPSS